MKQPTDRLRRIGIEASLLLLMILIGAYLRYTNLLLAPGWYPDEGSNIEHATRFVHGPYHYFAVSGTPLVSGRMPLYLLVFGWVMDWLGKDFIIGRILTATAGVLTIPLLYLALRRELGSVAAFGAAGFFAIMPLAVTYNRFAFSYNWHMPLFILFFWAALELVQTRQARWALIMALATSAAIATELAAVPLGIVLAVMIWAYQRRALWWSILIAIAPSAIYFAWYYIHAPDQVALEMNIIALYGAKNWSAQLLGVIFDYASFVAWDVWILLGIVGLFMIANARVRIIALAILTLVLFNVLRAFGAADLGMHRVLGVLPFLAIGVFIFIRAAFVFVLQYVASDFDVSLMRLGWRPTIMPRLRRWVQLLVVPLIVFFILVSPLMVAVISDLVGLVEGASTRIDYVLARKPSDTLATIDYLNANIQPNHLVIASPQVGWAIDAKVAEYMQTLSLEGYPTTHYPILLTRERLMFDCSLEQARFVVVDNFWRRWGVQANPALQKLIDRVSQWPIAFQRGEYTVYRNPSQ